MPTPLRSVFKATLQSLYVREHFSMKFLLALWLLILQAEKNLFRVVFIINYVLINISSLFINCFFAEKLRTEVALFFKALNFQINIVGMKNRMRHWNRKFFQSSEVFHKVYEIEWYRLRPPQSKSLIIIMCNSRKPFQLTAGKFIVLSMEYFGKVWLTIYYRRETYQILKFEYD